MENNRLIVLSGPTASGKTSCGLGLARLFPLEIVNADSMQVYRGMDIGTAKPTTAERREVPHHLVDVVDPDEPWNAGRFVSAAEEAIRGIRERGRFPLLVGGTGLYIRSLLRGLDPLPSDPTVRARLARRWDEEGGEVLHRELERVDPASAAKVHPADRVRVVRALEVAEMTGEPPSTLRSGWAGARSRFPVLFLVLSPDRGALYRRIDLRVDAMFREGLVEEVRGLLGRGFRRALPSMGGLGYRHVVAHLLDEVPRERTMECMKRDTRRYAKRQISWLSAEPGTVRIAAADPLPVAVEMARKYLF